MRQLLGAAVFEIHGYWGCVCAEVSELQLPWPCKIGEDKELACVESSCVK